MFSYCNNNPVNLTDETGHAAGMLGNTYYSSDCVDTDDKRRRSLSKYTYNGQKNLPTSSIEFGDYTMGSNGCAILATYNALLLTEVPGELRTSLSMLIHFYEDCRTNPLGNRFGVFPDEIGPCLTANNREYIGTSSYEEFVAYIEAGYVGIMTVWNGDSILDGAHTVAVCGYSDGTIDIFNSSNYSSIPKNVDKMGFYRYVYSEGGSFIYGYIIIDEG